MKAAVVGIGLFLVGLVNASSDNLHARGLIEQGRYLEVLETNSTAS
jgi:uncharacterized membrane protein YiaA